MAIKKSELYASLWSSCDELRGGMDASQYKDYILTLLFMKYVSDKYAGDPDAVVYIPEGGGFADMVAVKGDKEIGDKINKIIAKLAEANNLKGVVDQADFNDEDRLGRGQEMVERLTKLVAIFEGLDLSANRAEGDDLLGDAYEYLMRHFATESGKSKGQFYTPAEVSRIMAKVVGIGPSTRAQSTIYDPTCGSGSLLLKAADEAPKGMSIFGQEMDNATWALAKMNLILHGYATAELWRGNTLAAPHFRNPNGDLATFDFAVANPPFSTKAWTSGLNPAHDDFQRFVYGIPPQKNGDYAFLLHLLTSLKSSGKGAIILPHGVLFRGGAEAAIRREIVRRGFVKGIIGLPANLFYGTGIPACIIVLDKEQAATRTGIFMIDAAKGFAKDGPKNRLRDQDIHKIVDTFTRRQEVPRYARMVPLAEIEANDFNLNIPRYIDSSEPEDLHDLRAHLQGGIPDRDIDALAAYWEVLPSVRDLLFAPLRPGYSELNLPIAEVKAAIFAHPEFTAFNQQITAIFERWQAANEPRLRGIAIGDNPKDLIAQLSESLLAAFLHAPLVDAYAIYQHLMDYWSETMQDDVYLIAHGGWLEAAKPRLIVESKDKKSKETPDFTIGKQKYKSDLIPAELIIKRYFAAEQAEIDALLAEQAAIEAQLEEMQEEHGGEDGLLAEVMDDKGKISKGAIAARLKIISLDRDANEERDVLKCYSTTLESIGSCKSRIKMLEDSLLAAIAQKFGKLEPSEVVTLVVKEKWLTTLASEIQSDLERVAQRLAFRVQSLGGRYHEPLPVLTTQCDELSGKVGEYLSSMGIVWT